MGTDVVVLAPSTSAGEVVRHLFARWERTLSRFQPESELSRLNAASGSEVRVRSLLWRAVGAALRAAAATDGLFDPAMLAPLEALGYDRTFVEVPPDGPGDRAAPVPGGAWRAVAVDARRRSIRLPAGARLDLGGIAKGMAVDAAVADLRDRGAIPAAVDAGGDLAIAGLPPGRAAWPVRVETLDGGVVVGVREGALATSSTTRRRWRRGGEERHHLLDPRTGRPAATDVLSVTVAAHACEQADVAAKVALVLGSKEGVRFLAARGLTGLLVCRDGEQIRVGAWTDDSSRATVAAGSPAR